MCVAKPLEIPSSAKTRARPAQCVLPSFQSCRRSASWTNSPDGHRTFNKKCAQSAATLHVPLLKSLSLHSFAAVRASNQHKWKSTSSLKVRLDRRPFTLSRLTSYSPSWEGFSIALHAHTIELEKTRPSRLESRHSAKVFERKKAIRLGISEER